MTLQEAIQSGKNFKLKADRDFYAAFDKTKYINSAFKLGLRLSYADILSSDWEVEEEKFLVTEGELQKLFKGAVWFSWTDECTFDIQEPKSFKDRIGELRGKK